jgi:agmatine deiminase
MTATLSGTPAADGFRMPGEFEPHDGCWLLWPERTDTWRDAARPAQAAYAAVATAIAAAEPVTVGVSDACYEDARAVLPADVRVVELSSDDAWMRDVGPTFVVDGAGRRRAVDFRFNAWGGDDGGLYTPWERDDRVAAKVAEIEGADRYRTPIVLEGGSICVDGDGTLLTTEECLLNPNRNPELTRLDLERHLHDWLGVERVVWLGDGVVDDETDGHVDNLVAFARPGVVVLTWTDDPSDPQHARSVDARRRLEAAVDARGRAFEVHLVHQPGPLHVAPEEAAGVVPMAGTKPRTAGDRMAASYVNHYVANGRVVVPLLDARTDDAALAVIQRLHPDREVIGISAREILLGGGNVHCITQQVPRAPA